ncbi:MAG TPA: LLM class flavin-dependent oxidoreductase [Mesorhizobium sp.]|jgi:alkanesulfonate monooxygenase SsuD/methylene tetrahydromethanopterin reductase-like flavin-dependent oxidoreductase (luciferase family)|nr:LLM class flavin-dependent oxidoreductase [Mesorhizobium sp.]
MSAKTPHGLAITGAFVDWPLDRLREVVVRADRAGVGLVVLPDSIAPAQGGTGWPDALILIGWLATSTERIKLIARVSSLGHQPYNLARRLASLNLISNGRAGWLVENAVQSAEDAHAAFSGAFRLGGVDLDERHGEFLSIVERLWTTSWDADALVMDKQAGLFFRPEAMHNIDHHGPHFSVRGPLNVMRSPRGAPDLLRHADLEDVVPVENPHAALALLEDPR